MVRQPHHEVAGSDFEKALTRKPGRFPFAPAALLADFSAEKLACLDCQVVVAVSKELQNLLGPGLD